MAKRMLADVLWEAANTWLSPTYVKGWAQETGDGLCSYSCHAMQAAIERTPPVLHHSLPQSVSDFASALGCDGSATCGKTLDFDQGSRYLWLLLAAKVAEDERIEL